MAERTTNEPAIAAVGAARAPEEHAAGPEASKLGIFAFLATEILLFGGLFTAYIVFRAKYPDMFYRDHFNLDRVYGATNTVVLICSSFTVALAIASIKRGKQALLKLYLALTILLAGTFLVIKYFEYMEDFAKGLYPSTDIFYGVDAARSAAAPREDQVLSSQPFLKVGFIHLLASSLLVIIPLVASYVSLPS